MKIVPIIVAVIALTATAGAQSPILRVEPGGHTAEVRQVVFLPGGKELVTVGEVNVIRIWDVRTGRHRAIRYEIGLGIEGQLFCAALGGPKKNVLAVGEAGAKGDILLFDLSTGAQMKRIDGPPGTLSSVAFTPDASRLVCTGAGIVRAYNLPSCSVAWEKKLEKQLPGARGREGALHYYTFSASISPDGRQVAAGCVDGNLRIWQMTDGKETANLPFNKEVLATAWSTKGILACGTRDGIIRYWNPATNDEPVR